jgi:A/G-specific adenine glycosylase
MSNEKEFAKAILHWFQIEGRDFPWRETRDPYKILLAEKLLQQTSVRESLIKLYITLTEKFPTSNHLADADIEELRVFIQPLGLHYRARDLILMACDIKERFGGNVPVELDQLLSLYGVGEYSARAVLSFAYGKNVAVVDTNVARILYRVYGILEKFPSNPARSRKLIELASNIVPPQKSKEFNWAMIDLGSKVCKPKKPLCEECPLIRLCNYYCSTLVVKQ